MFLRGILKGASMGLSEIFVQTNRQTEFIDITSKVQSEVSSNSILSGLVTIYCPHTTGAVTINEGADPAVKEDILSVLNKIIPWDYDYRHLEGNSPAHIKSSIIGESVTVIIEGGKLQLGTWQKIFFCEFDGPRKRRLWLKFMK